LRNRKIEARTRRHPRERGGPPPLSRNQGPYADRMSALLGGVRGRVDGKVDVPVRTGNRGPHGRTRMSALRAQRVGKRSADILVGFGEAPRPRPTGMSARAEAGGSALPGACPQTARTILPHRNRTPRRKARQNSPSLRFLRSLAAIHVRCGGTARCSLTASSSLARDAPEPGRPPRPPFPTKENLTEAGRRFCANVKSIWKGPGKPRKTRNTRKRRGQSCQAFPKGRILRFIEASLLPRILRIPRFQMLSALTSAPLWLRSPPCSPSQSAGDPDALQTLRGLASRSREGHTRQPRQADPCSFALTGGPSASRLPPQGRLISPRPFRVFRVFRGCIGSGRRHRLHLLQRKTPPKLTKNLPVLHEFPGDGGR